MRALIISISAMMMAVFASPVWAGSSTADALAQKFSEASDRPSLDYEMDMLRRARAEEVERKTQGVLPAPSAQEPVQPATAQASPPAAQPAAAAPIPLAHPAAAEPSAVPVALPKAEEPASPSVAADRPAVDPAGPHASVLLVLESDAGGGKPDPILCFGNDCWVSNGITKPAEPLTRQAAVALKTTETPERDSCTGKSGCVYRDVTLPADASLEIIHAGAQAASAGQTFAVELDKSCKSDSGDLICANGLVTQDYRAWVVPEATAISIGNEALEDAVADGLPDDDGPATADK